MAAHDPAALGFAHAISGDAVLATQSALWAATTDVNFSDSVACIVNASGDTDTHGAIAGAVFGARYGDAAIPRQWLDAIPQYPRIERLADTLHHRGDVQSSATMPGCRG